MQNEGSRSFLGIKLLFVNGFSKILWHFSRLLECERMIRSHKSIEGGMQKRQSPKDGVRRVGGTN